MDTDRMYLAAKDDGRLYLVAMGDGRMYLAVKDDVLPPTWPVCSKTKESVALGSLVRPTH